MGSQINKHQRTFAKFYENQNRQKIDKKIIFKIEIDKKSSSKSNSRFESAILIEQIWQQQKIADFRIPRRKFADSGDLGHNIQEPKRLSTNPASPANYSPALPLIFHFLFIVTSNITTS